MQEWKLWAPGQIAQPGSLVLGGGVPQSSWALVQNSTELGETEILLFGIHKAFPKGESRDFKIYKQLMQFYVKNTNRPIKKMGIRPKQTFLQRRYTGGHKAHGMIVNTAMY